MGDTPDSGFPAGGGTPPHAAEGQHALDALGATAPLDSTVVHVAFGVDRGQGDGEGMYSSFDGDFSAGPPPPPDSAVAQTSGTGGEVKPAGKPGADKKPPKPVDWGKYNYLLENFAAEVEELKDAVFVGLGPQVQKVLDRLIQERVLNPDRVIGGMLHPSGNCTYRINYLIGDRIAPVPHATNPVPYDQGRRAFRKRFVTA